MMWSRRLCATVLVLGVFGVLATAEPTLVDTRIEQLQTRDGSGIEVEYGFLVVPENRLDPKSRDIRLAYIRTRSGNAPAGASPLVMIACGPGGSSIDLVEGFVGGGGERLISMIGRDVIGIDQRGVGRSEPNLESDVLFGLDPSAPGDPEQMLLKMRAVCAQQAQAMGESGIDLRGYTSVQSADDFDDARRAMGYEKLVLWGGSYGSHLAMATIRRHGAHIERALLTGPEGPDHTLKLPSQMQTVLERIADLAKRDKGLGMPDLLGTLGSVLERADAEPISVEVDGEAVGISGFDIRRAVFHRMYTVRDGIVTIPAFVARLADGDFEPLARELMKEREEEGVWSMMAMVMDAASGASEARRARIEQELDQALLGDVMNFPTDSIGDALGAPDLGASYRGVLESDVPMLFIVGDLDAMTPVSNAKALMEHMPNAQLVVVEHVAHNDLPLGMPELFPIWSGFIAGKSVQSKTISAPAPSFEPIVKAKADRATPVADVASAPEFDVSLLIGRYDLGRAGTLEVRTGASGVLEASIGDEAPQRVRAVSEHELEWIGSDQRLELRVDRGGTVKRAFYFNGSRRIIAQKR